MQPETLETSPKPKPNRKPIIIGVAIVAVIAAAWYGNHTIQFNRGHETTDNAAVAGDLVQIAPQIPGTIQEILVTDNESVKKGQLLFVLDDAKYRVALEKAEADYAGALADAKAAGFGVEAAQAVSNASHLDSQGQVAQSTAGIANGTASVQQAEASVLGATANAQGSLADVESAKADIASAKANWESAKRQLDSATQAIAVAGDSVQSATANLRSAQSQAALAENEYKRNADLLAAGAISQRQLDQAETNRTLTQSAVQSAQAQVTNAQDVVLQRKADYASQQAKVAASVAAIRLSESKLNVARSKATSSQASIRAAQAQVSVAEQALAAARGKLTQSESTGQTATANSVKIAQSMAARDQALARIKTAKSAVDNAKLDLTHTKIYAPKSGQLGRRSAQIGAEAQANVALVTLVPDGGVYVTANFKETQTHRIKAGDIVDIEVDGLPTGSLEGKVESIASATGSTFTLLPPDNATGNFVKVVQRIPVKISFAHPGDAAKVRVGMSVTAVVRVGS